MKTGIQRQAVRLSQWLSPALFACLFAAVVTIPLLFLTPIHGLADNGDFYRAMLSNGIYRLPSQHSQYLSFVIQKFGLMQYFNENNVAVFSSQTLVVKLAVLLNELFYSRHIFDIRFLAAVYEGFFLGAIYLLTKALVHPHRNISSYIIAALVVLMFADGTMTLYFNSFFAEPGMLIAAMYLFAALMAIVHKCYRHDWPMIVLFVVSTVFLITNKQQNAPLALSFIVAGAGLLFLPTLSAHRLAIIASLVLILGAGGLTYKLINSEFSTVNQYQALTHGALIETSDPSRKLEKQGLNEAYALMRNENYYPKTFTAVKPSDPNIQKQLLNKYGTGWLIRYYAENPKQFAQLMDLAAKDVMQTRVSAVGDFARGSGKKAGAQSTFFTGYSRFMSNYFPGRYAFDCLLAVAFRAIYSVSAWLDYRAKRTGGLIRFFLVTGLMTVCVFVPIISIIGDGDADLAKHLFMVPVCYNLTFILFVSDVLNKRLWLANDSEETTDDA
ncbi:hypothetical protein ABPD29_06400 [Secundilactobacillus paracollinoides]|uniref:Glycosyltransferase RgtA/B/C/D-like domain-containing protein n=1 Tax=Secundilactobacillus paracollinoides TaxID=240427 RepID=A0A1B2IZ66_9LACO|nr:hypothetical protein [Secundilactobacillus paracollinoides]ANZ67337.1 hypothetical protein AYR63_09385 [Secundilactobacillus paracollinoides]